MTNAGPHTTRVQISDGAVLLIVDDDLFVRRALRRLLALEGTSVIEAADGEQALRLIEQDESQRLDVVLTNLLMPVVSGPELIAVLLQRRPTLPVVAMSALDTLPRDFPGALPAEAVRIGPADRNARAAGPPVASDAAAGTAVARGERRTAYVGRTATRSDEGVDADAQELTRP